MRYRSKADISVHTGARAGNPDDDLVRYLLQHGHLTPDNVETIYDHMAVEGTRFAASAIALDFVDRQVIDAATPGRGGRHMLTPGDPRVDAALVAAFGTNEDYVEDIRAIRARLVEGATRAGRQTVNVAVIAFDSRDDAQILAANLGVLMARGDVPALIVEASRVGIGALDLFADTAEEGLIAPCSAIPGLWLLRLPSDATRDASRSIGDFTHHWPAGPGNIVAVFDHDPNVSTASIISLVRDVDSVLLILRKGVTEYVAVQELIDALDRSGIHLEGSVLI